MLFRVAVLFLLVCVACDGMAVRQCRQTSLLSRAVKGFACTTCAALLLCTPCGGGSMHSWAEESAPPPAPTAPTAQAAPAPTAPAEAAKPMPPMVYGLKKGRLLECRAKSNCISTSSVKSVEKYSRPWEWKDLGVDEEYEEVLGAVRSMQYIKIVEADKERHYIHATAKSAFPPSSLDDVEFLLNPLDKIITYRSNSRYAICHTLICYMLYETHPLYAIYHMPYAICH
jgi:uncharacterized protein (DUF1499 family)